MFVAGLELVAAAGSLGDSLDGVGGVVVAHELGEGGCSNKSADISDTLNETANGSGFVLGGGFDASLGLGDDEAPDGNRNGAEGLAIGA